MDKSHRVYAYTVMGAKLPFVTQETDLETITWNSLKSTKLNAWGWQKGKTVSGMITKETENTISLHIN